MTSNPILRFLLEDKRVPNVVNVTLQVVTATILYSFLLMATSTFLLHPEWSGKDVQESIPFLAILAPYSFYITPNEVSFIWGASAMLLVWGSWLFSTRVKMTNKSVRRRMVAFMNTWASFCLIIITFCLVQIKVIGYEKVVSYHYTIAEEYQQMMHIGSLQMIGYLLMIIPIGVMVSFSSYLLGQYQEDERIKEWFRTFKYENGWLGRFGEEAVNKLPDIQLARNAETNAPVIMQGESRQLGTLLIGPPGSGKTSIKIKTSYRTDLGHIQRMINAYPTYKQKYGYGSEEFIKSMADHLIGSIIIEPAKDLCDDAYELALEHGIPKEFVVYLDPTNPNTPGFNMMVGPTAQIVETITAVLESVAETKDEFFKQAARAVLKHYVYLLKLTRGDNCTILDLDDLYQDSRKAMDLLEELEQTVPSQGEINEMEQDDRIHWIIVQKIVRWFRNEGLSVSTTRDGMVEKYPVGHEHAGKPKVNDLQFEFTRQTRNLLSDITKNPYLARILYADNEVQLDRIFNKGGILLVNTDLGNLAQLSPIFGKLVLLCVQNAVFRRKGNEKTRPMVSFYADEFYDYMNEAFLQLTSQGRKFKFAPLVACQSLTQFGVKFGKEFTESMLGTIRNTIVYGGTSLYDTEMLSSYLGTEIVEELQVREGYTPSYMETPTFTRQESVTLKEQEIATSDDIMFQEFRYSYIRMVDEKSSKRAIRAVGDFVDTSEAEKWKKALKPDSLEIFMDDWRSEEREMLEEDGQGVTLQEQLNELNEAQEHIRNITEQELAEPVTDGQEFNRFKPYEQPKAVPSTVPSRENYFQASHREVNITQESISLSSESVGAVPVTANPLKEEQVQATKLRVKEAIVKDTSMEENIEIPPVVESPFSSTKQNESLLQPTMSFSAAFGSKDKEKVAQVSPKKKETTPSSFSAAFSIQEETAVKKGTVSADNLEEVKLDEQSLSFLNDLIESSSEGERK